MLRVTSFVHCNHSLSPIGSLYFPFAIFVDRFVHPFQISDRSIKISLYFDILFEAESSKIRDTLDADCGIRSGVQIRSEFELSTDRSIEQFSTKKKNSYFIPGKIFREAYH